MFSASQFDMNDNAALRRDPNFRWLMSGAVISALGDQFSMIALPWLILQLTGDPLALGMMVAVMVGVLLLPMGLVAQAWQGVLLLASIGVLGGFVQVAVFTWIQQCVPQAMLGRMMGIFMFVFMGLAPLAAAGVGWLASLVSLASLFAAAGLSLLLFALLAWLFTPMTTLADAAQPARNNG